MARILVFAVPLDTLAERAVPAGGVRWARHADLPELRRLGMDGRWLDWAFAEAGARIAVVEQDGLIVGCNGFAVDRPVPQYSWLTLLSVDGADVAAFGGFVAPACRGQRLHTHLKGFAARHFRDAGYRRMVSCVETGNAASLRSHRQGGAVVARQLRRLRFGRLLVLWSEPGPRRLRLSVGRPFVVSA